jgi:hypothetical protein
METSAEDGEISTWRALATRLRRDPAYRAFRKKVRAAKRVVPNLLRRMTHRYRQLPGLVVVGAQKAGTTQLHACLIRHPRVFGAAAKELQYFSKRSDRPVSWYRSQFPLSRTVESVGGISVEATPSYLPTPQALRMMGSVLPATRVVVLLRDPVSRAFSHYQHYKTRQAESRTFADAIHELIERPLYEPTAGAALASEAPPMLDYVSRGYYALQLEVLFDTYPRDRVLVIDSAELFADTNAVCQQVFAFIGLDPCDVPPKKIHNRGYYREKIDAASAARLREHYRPHDELLVKLLGRRLRWMDEPSVSTSTSAAA